MRTLSISLLLFICTGSSFICAQPLIPQYPDSLFSTYYHQRRTLFESLPQSDGDILFVGNSITDGAEWAELFKDLRVKNRGISGDITAGVLRRAAELSDRKPAKLFLLIGINDLARGLSTDSVVSNILLFVRWMKAESPSTRLFIQSLLPVSDRFNKFSGHTNKRDSVLKVNERLRQEAPAGQYTFINLYPSFAGPDGKLDPAYSNDGLHLTGAGYLLWQHLVYPYVYDLQEKASLLPLPVHLQWTATYFPLYKAENISVNDSGLLKQAVQLQEIIREKGRLMAISTKVQAGEKNNIRLEKVSGSGMAKEAYTLSVTADAILIRAATAQGIFYGIQTLRQLMRDNLLIDGCDISDQPAFSWRGYMVDAARNYMPVEMLKEQLAIMAACKLNIFHFHLTEDIAWRLESKKYPQLTAAGNMQRNPGEYYALDEMRELIAYCRERFITLVPEIDMPGHSAAFKRAMGVDMQSDSGMAICREILLELCRELDVPYVHIGGDEVKITNKQFLPEMVKLLRAQGKTVIGWDPGGNLPAGTYVQLWNGKSVPRPGYPAIDSRHLYLNHFDPLEGVSATYNHIICDTVTETADRKGATLCLWPDRRVSTAYDMITMNAVYPVLLTFAERCWQGGGVVNFSSVINAKNKAGFSAFEKRLKDQGRTALSGLPFPYVAQSDIEWKLIGPYANGGNTALVFPPESPGFSDTVQLAAYPSVTGGTIWLRHFWDPMIQSHLQVPRKNNTWYATRKIWCDEAGERAVWISFNDLSRSPATDSPPAGAWDTRNSTVWVNGEKVQPPQWKRGGQKGHPEIPLVDEGYTYRAPIKIQFRKGWNDVLIKAPVAGFTGDWQQPVKWMFVFVLAPEKLTRP